MEKFQQQGDELYEAEVAKLQLTQEIHGLDTQKQELAETNRQLEIRLAKMEEAMTTAAVSAMSSVKHTDEDNEAEQAVVEVEMEKLRQSNVELNARVVAAETAKVRGYHCRTVMTPSISLTSTPTYPHSHHCYHSHLSFHH